MVVDIAKITAPYENKWVALSEDYKSILAADDDVLKLHKTIGDKKLKAVFFFVPPFDGIFVHSVCGAGFDGPKRMVR